MRPFTLDELSALSPEQAVAGRFDESNLAKARGFLIFFALASLGGSIGAAFADPRRLAVLLPNFLFVLTFSLALRRHRLGLAPEAGRDRMFEPARRLIVRQPRAAIVTLLIVELIVAMLAGIGSGALIPLVVIQGFYVLAFLVRPAERLLIHGTLVLGLVVSALFGATVSDARSDDPGSLVAVVANHAFALAIGLDIARRKRKEILAIFTAAQASARDQLRMRQELDYAREIQLAMLPAGCPPQGWLDICSLSWPATEVGGDYYDYFPLDGGRLAVVVGDVAGHGMASGLLLAGVRSCLTILAADLDRPLEVLAKLNLMVQQTARRRKLVTLAIVILDPMRRIATIANAGHPPVLLATAAGVEEISLPSLPLGTQLPPNFGLRELPLAPDDVLLLHSDGLYEGVDRFAEPYGLERLAASLAALPKEIEATAVRDALLADFAAFQDGADQRDDLTFVVVKVAEAQ